MTNIGTVVSVFKLSDFIRPAAKTATTGECITRQRHTATSSAIYNRLISGRATYSPTSDVALAAPCSPRAGRGLDDRLALKSSRTFAHKLLALTSRADW